MPNELNMNGSAPIEKMLDPHPPKTFHWTPGLIAGLILFGIIMIIGIFAPLVLSDSANTLTSNAALPPSRSHWFGTDEFGRDMFARSLVATRITLIMTIAATAITVILGTIIGTGIWLSPRRLREMGLRFLEVAVSYPGLLVALIITAILGAGAGPVVVGIGIASIPGFARFTATLASDVSRRDFVVTAQLIGVPPKRLIVRHLLPNMAEPMLVLLSTAFAVSLIDLSGLSFIGLGVQAPQYDYGKLLTDALPAIYTRPEQVLGPALMIVLAILGAMLIGDGLAAAADPRTAQRWRKPSLSPTLSVIPADADSDSAFVVVDGLTVTTDRGAELLHNVSFSMARGEILGVVGESGSGKSITAMSLAKLLPDGLHSDASQIRVGKLNILGRPSRAELAETVSIIYQDPGTTFNPALKMGPQLTEVQRRHMKRTRTQANSTIVEALRAVQITEPAKRLTQHPHELSGGMRQRAMIAAALATGPQLIIADEPTTALDVTVQAEILRELRRINQEHGLSMLFISHDIKVVEALCDRVLVMQDGVVVEEVTGQQLGSRRVHHAYTKKLIAATPSIEFSQKDGGHPDD